MRVLLVTRPGIGGAARHVLDLVTGLSPTNEIRVLASPIEDAGFLNRMSHAGADVDALPMERGPSFRSDVAAVRAVRREVRRFGPDVIHAHAFKAGAVARLAARTVPVVYSPHGFYHLYPTAPRAARRVARMVERRLAARTAVLALCAEWEREAASRDGLDRGGAIAVVPNGVPIPEPIPLERRTAVRDSLGVGPEQVLVLMVGRLAAPKEPGLFADAAEGAPPHLRYLLVGDGPEREAIRSREIPSLITAGYRDDLPDLLGASDIGALATSFEAAPYFLLQAMAAGLPCVATDIPATREVLGDAGIVVPAKADALRNAVAALADDTARRSMLGEAGRARAVTSYSVGRMLDAVRDAWEAAAEGG